MPEALPNLGLTVHDDDEFFDIEHANGNSRLIDTWAGEVERKLRSAESQIKDAPLKSTVSDNDAVVITDSAASDATKRIRWSALWDKIKTLVSGLFVLKSGDAMTGPLRVPSYSAILAGDGDEGGQMIFAKPPGSTVIDNVVAGAYANTFRFFTSKNGTIVGAYIDFSEVSDLSCKFWHSGNFDPNSKVNKAGGVMTGPLTASNPARGTAGAHNIVILTNDPGEGAAVSYAENTIIFTLEG